MKTQKIVLPFITAIVLALGLVSCSKKESVTTTTEDSNKAAETATTDAAKAADAARAEAARMADVAKVEAAKTADAAKAEALKAEESAKAAVAKATDNSKAQELIDRVKSLVAEKKFTDASGMLQQLTGQSLSPDQEKLLDSLKKQIQKALAAQAAGNAADSVGNLLKK